MPNIPGQARFLLKKTLKLFDFYTFRTNPLFLPVLLRGMKNALDMSADAPIFLIR